MTALIDQGPCSRCGCRWQAAEILPCPSCAEDEAVEKRINQLKRENDFLRALVGNSDKSCVYCGLGAEEQGQCKLGFPGCSRGDDQMLCREVGVAMERDELKKLVIKGYAVVLDFMPNVRNCVLQNYQRLNEFLIEAEKLVTAGIHDGNDNG